jgi:hypothetical protein
MDVATAFGSTANVISVWKWVAALGNWAFYAPSLSSQALADYAAARSYQVLTTINGGEGFWVNARWGFTAQLPAGAAVMSTTFQPPMSGNGNLLAGWNLIAIGDNRTPSDFNKALSNTPPSPGVIPINLTSLWAWDNAQGNWYFYAPSLEANGGLGAYVASHGYLDFGAKRLAPASGFWVNKP